MLRQKINDHLDKDQAKLFNELSETEVNTNKRAQELLKSLKVKELDVMKMQQNIVKLKQNGSDLQTFMYMKQVKTSAVQSEYYLELLKEQGELDQVELIFHVNDAISTFLEKLQSFGNISAETIKSINVIERVRATQAQTHINKKIIANITMELIRKIQHGCGGVCGCCLLSNGTAIFSDNEQDKIAAVNEKGSINFEMNVQNPHGITSIDDNTLAVASLPNIRIIDIDRRLVKRTITAVGEIYGMIYKNGTLICCENGKGIISVSLEDDSVTSIVDCNLPSFSYITTHGDNIYYTGGLGSNMVTCCDFKGNIQWTFGDGSVLEAAREITTDENGFIYVCGYISDNVVVISSDGQQSRIILNKDIGIIGPRAIHYNKTRKEILVSNYKKQSFVFKIHFN